MNPTPSAPGIHASPAPHHGPQFDWREYYHVLRSRAWLILICVVLSTLYGLFKAATTPPMYQARAVLVIEEKSKVLSGKLEDVSDTQIRSVDMVNTLIELLSSYPFALRVVNHLKLSTDRAFLVSAGLPASGTSPERAAASLCRMIKPAYRLNTRLIDIFVTSRSPSESVLLANAIPDEYQQYIQDQKRQTARSASSFLMDEADRLRKKMRASEEGMQGFRERERAASMESMLAEAQTQISELSKRQGAIDSKLTQISSDLEVARHNTGNTSELLRLPSVAGDPKIAALMAQISSLEKEFTLAQQRYRAKHPLYINISTQLAFARKELDKMLTDIVGLLESIRTSLEAQQSATKVERETAEKRLLDVTGKSIEYNDLKRELESDRALYDSVLGRIKEVDVTKELVASPVTLQEAAVGSMPVGAPPLVVLIKAMLSGLAIGVALVLGIYKLDTSLKTVDEVEHATQLRVVAAVPQVGDVEVRALGFLSRSQYAELAIAFRDALKQFLVADRPLTVRLSEFFDAMGPSFSTLVNPNKLKPLTQGSELVAKDDRSGMVAEAFRSLRATVAMNLHAENQRTFLLTSAFPSEGKSFSNSNFAITLAQQGLKTLLIDADLRKPVISRMFFGMHRKPGLSEVLLGNVSLQDAVCPSGVEGLSILAAGGRSQNPSELLAGQPFRNMLTEALKHYDRVVIDSAPVLAVSDTLLIAPSVEVLCLVVRACVTPAKVVKRALKALDEVHFKPAGIVFNCVPMGSNAYGSYYYSGKYGETYGSKGVYENEG